MDLTLGSSAVPNTELVFVNQAVRASSAITFLATLYVSSSSERPFAGLTKEVVGQVADWGTYVDNTEDAESSNESMSGASISTKAPQKKNSIAKMGRNIEKGSSGWEEPQI